MNSEWGKDTKRQVNNSNRPQSLYDSNDITSSPQIYDATLHKLLSQAPNMKLCILHLKANEIDLSTNLMGCLASTKLKSTECLGN